MDDILHVSGTDAHEHSGDVILPEEIQTEARNAVAGERLLADIADIKAETGDSFDTGKLLQFMQESQTYNPRDAYDKLQELAAMQGKPMKFDALKQKLQENLGTNEDTDEPKREKVSHEDMVAKLNDELFLGVDE